VSNAQWYSKPFIAAARLLRNTAPTFAEFLTIESVSQLSKRADTCCIHVPDGEWFSLANGAVVHNSHHGDAFSYGALVMNEKDFVIKESSPNIRGLVMHYPGFGMKTGDTLEEMWAENALNRVERV
jgi:hypothetical protein